MPALCILKLDKALEVHRSDEANWQLPMLAEATPVDSKITVIVADSAYGSLEPEFEDQVVMARGRTDKQGKKPVKAQVFPSRGEDHGNMSQVSFDLLKI